jgi:hypothetical protein
MKQIVASLVVWGALATCAVMRNTTVTDSQAAAFQIGAATPADVVARLGAPFGRGNDADGSVVLDYVHWSMIPLDASQRQVIFRFAPDGRLAKIETVHSDGAIFIPLTSQARTLSEARTPAIAPGRPPAPPTAAAVAEFPATATAAGCRNGVPAAGAGQMAHAVGARSGVPRALDANNQAGRR